MRVCPKPTPTGIKKFFKGESFSFRGFDCRRVENHSRTGYFILMTPILPYSPSTCANSYP